jgi:leucyl aminopeptidase
MKITFTNKRDQKAEFIAVLVGQKSSLSLGAKEIDKASGGMISNAIKASDFEGNSGQMLDVLAPAKVNASRVILVGVGDPAKLTLRMIEDIGGRIVARGRAGKGKGVHVFADVLKGCEIDGSDVAAHLAYGSSLKSYTFNHYFTTGDKAKKPILTRMIVVGDDTRKARANFATLDKIAQGVFLTRDLVSEPSNVIYPESLAKKCKELEKLGVKVDVLTERRLKDLGMNALLGVGQGSARESRVVVMEWNGINTAKGRKAKVGPVAIVGKGVTFDTGGISLKPPGGMEMMKWDMGGSATVVGLMKALAGREAKTHVVGIVGLVENMPSGTAQRPGDVVTSMSGQTIEVINTDAEGRLVLADVLHYAQKRFNPRLVIDLATLTGAIITSLGNEYAGMFSNNDDLCNQLSAAGEAESEKVWRMPMSSRYDKMINSPIADMKNVGAGAKAGSITAAQFLKRYIMNDTPWAHLDIAGTAWNDTERPTVPKGGAGYGVRLLNRFIADNHEK